MNSLLQLLVVFILSALPLAILHRVSHNLKKRRFPFSDRLLRPAGYSVGKKVDNLILDLLTIIISCIFVGLIATWGFYFQKTSY